MILRADLVNYLDKLLNCSDFNDYAPNGLQIEGSNTIRRICTAVTASLDVIERAIAVSADALLVHHGYFWRGEDPVLRGMKRQRISYLLQHNINLLAYHLPLDCHLELGNNVCLGQLFGLESIESHRVNKTDDLLWTGFLSQAKTGPELCLQLSHIFGREPLHIEGCNTPIQYLAWCSGGAQDFIEQAHELGADAYISGEVSERTYYQAKELGLDYFACGHHATERYGIQALGQHLVQRFGLEHQFIDSLNPV
jgi:dinuclear metal center YbgI/SA1388 family protein